ncbi:MAG TPA: AI-2E family transporter [Bryobacteraceae bacterium]|nr:AI-2E family transporter [Bryobacteraceae bacterium]
MAILTRHLKPQELLNAAELRVAANPVIALGVIVALLYWARVFFITLIIAVTIAFILEPFVGLLMRIRFPRSVASFVVCSIALMLIYLVGLGAYTQLAGLWEELPRFSERIGAVVDGAKHKIDDMEAGMYRVLVPAKQQQQQPAPAPPQPTRRRRNAEPAPVLPQGVPGAIPEVRIHEDRKPITDLIYERMGSLYQILLMASFIPFLVYFMLSWRDHIHRSFLQFFEGEDRVAAARSLQGIGDMVRGFVVGNFVLGVLLAVISSLAFWGIHLPYPLLAGPVSGFLSLVPYVGLPLALIPPAIVAIGGGHALGSFLIILFVIAMLHLIALNLLYPKIVGSRVHLNPLVVTVALMFWGFLWDAAGLLLAIPLTAALKAVCDNVKSLRPFGKFLGD